METRSNQIAAELDIDMNFGDNAMNVAHIVTALNDDTGLAYTTTGGRGHCVTVTGYGRNELGGVYVECHYSHRNGRQIQAGPLHASCLIPTRYDAGVKARSAAFFEILAAGRERGEC